MSNLLAFLVSTLVIIIVPKLIGIEDYGYWQLYLFYASYVGFMHLGWNDGIYLRYGGVEYEKLEKKVFFSQFISLMFSQVLLGGIIAIITGIFSQDGNRSFILYMVLIAMVLNNTRLMLLFILQATSRIKEYAQITMLDRIIYLVLIVVFLFAGIRDYRIMILADLAGKFASLLLSMISCRDIVFRKIQEFSFTFQETFTNISSGVKLMFANIASMLIIGIVRFGIERTWNVATFGKISLTLSISNMMMLFINAVGIIIFPILRRTDSKKLPEIYTTMRDLLMTMLLGALIFYYPIKALLSVWLPQYAESLLYMALVFPMFLYEGKMALLINTYLKTLRKEKAMLQINMISMGISLVLTLLSTVVFHSLVFTIFNIVLILAFRAMITEEYLSRVLQISVRKDMFLEFLLTLVFIVSGWLINSPLTMLIYLIAYVVYLLLKRQDLKRTWQVFRSMTKSKG